MSRRKPCYHGQIFPPQIISYSVRLYYWFSLSFRDVEDLLAERGIEKHQRPYGFGHRPVISWQRTNLFREQQIDCLEESSTASGTSGIFAGTDPTNSAGVPQCLR